MKGLEIGAIKNGKWRQIGVGFISVQLSVDIAVGIETNFPLILQCLVKNFMVEMRLQPVQLIIATSCQGQMEYYIRSPNVTEEMNGIAAFEITFVILEAPNTSIN